MRKQEAVCLMTKTEQFSFIFGQSFLTDFCYYVEPVKEIIFHCDHYWVNGNYCWTLSTEAQMTVKVTDTFFALICVIIISPAFNNLIT